MKLIDFGFSKPLSLGEGGTHLLTKIGTPYFIAPEILEGKYGLECDLWSIGVLTYFVLSGKPPFDGEKEIAVYNKIKTCDYDFPDNDWKDISFNAKEFIKSLLHPNPKKRMSAEAAL